MNKFEKTRYEREKLVKEILGLDNYEVAKFSDDELVNILEKRGIPVPKIKDDEDENRVFASLITHVLVRIIIVIYVVMVILIIAGLFLL